MSSQIINIKPQYTNYLIDEAKFKGDAESISFPINKMKFYIFFKN